MTKLLREKKTFEPFYGPLGLPGCMIWLDGAYGVETDGDGLVTLWRNKSGGSSAGGYLQQSNPLYRPPYDAVNHCVYFDGTLDTHVSLDGDYHILQRFNYPDANRYLYAVFSIDNLAATRMVFNISRSGGYPPSFHAVSCYMDTSKQVTAYHSLVQGYGVARASYAYDNTSYSLGTKALSAQRSLFVGGTTYRVYHTLSNEAEFMGNTGGEGTWDYSKPPATGPGFGANYFVLGSNVNRDMRLQGKVYEFVLFVGDLSAEHNNLREYFRSKYSLW